MIDMSADQRTPLGLIVASLSVLLIMLWTLLGYFLIPLPLNDQFFAWLHRQWLLEGVAALTVIGAMGVAIHSWRTGRVSRISWWNAWWIWMLWASISLIYSIDLGVSLRSWLAFASYGLLAYVACALITAPQQVVIWSRCLVWVAVVVSLQGLWQYVRSFDVTLALMEQLRRTGELNFQGWGAEVIKDFLTRKRIFSVFGWPNLFAGFLLLTLPLAISLSVHGRGRFERIGWMMASALLGLCLMLTLSMGAWIAAVITGSLTWWLLRRSKNEVEPRHTSSRFRFQPKLAQALVVGVAISGILGVTSFILAKRARPFIRASTASRLVYVQGAWNVIRSAPVQGTGLGTFGLAYWSLIPLRYAGGQHSALHAHNTFLEIWAELGTVGLACFLLFLWQLWQLVRVNMARQSWGALGVLHRGLAIGVLGFFVHSILEQTFFETVTAPFWWIVVGLFTGAASTETGSPKQVVALHDRLRFVGLPLLLAALSGGSTLWLATADTWAGRAAFFDHAGRSQQALQAFEHSQQWNPLESRYPFEAAERVLSHLQGLPRAEVMPLWTQAQHDLQRTVSRSPWWGYAWMRLGLVSWQLGQTSQAIHAMRQAVRRDPNLREALTHLASMLQATAQFAPLKDIAQRLQQFDDRDPQGWLFEASAWQGLHQPARAIQTYRALLARTPHSYPAWFNLAELLRQEGNERDAAAAYQAFLDTAPHDQNAQRARARAFLEHIIE